MQQLIETGKKLAASEDNIITDIVADVSSVADAIIN